MFKNNKNLKAFTILEVTVALGIFMVGLLGVSSLAVQNLRAQNANQHTLIASMLAQEAAEIVRNKRDYNWLKYTQDDWQESDTPGSDYDILQTANGSTYTVEFDGDINSSVNNIADARMLINDNGFYNHTTGSSTPFYRLVEVTNNVDWLDVKVTVEWQEKGLTKDYEVDMKLYNWR